MSAQRIAIVQHCATEDVAQNLTTCETLCAQAASEGAEAIFLPEAFAFIGRDSERRQILEPLPEGGPILSRCAALARQCNADLILGGFHEQVPGSGLAANTAVHLNTAGEVVQTYRKLHLFDVDLPDGTRLQESARTMAGDTITLTELGFGTLGLSICYDLRFPELYQKLADRGAIAVTVPSAFTATTGAAHWHVLLRARAIEAQCYVIAPAQHGQHNAQRRSYGHSLVIDPWGSIIAELGEGDGYALATIDPERVASVRQALPSREHRRSLE